METSERTAKIVVILAPDGAIQRAYKTIHTVLIDGERSHTLDPRDEEITPEDAAAYFGEASAVTIEAVRVERERADAAESQLAEMTETAGAERARADRAEAKIENVRAALA